MDKWPRAGIERGSQTTTTAATTHPGAYFGSHGATEKPLLNSGIDYAFEITPTGKPKLASERRNDESDLPTNSTIQAADIAFTARTMGLFESPFGR